MIQEKGCASGIISGALPFVRVYAGPYMDNVDTNGVLPGVPADAVITASFSHPQNKRQINTISGVVRVFKPGYRKESTNKDPALVKGSIL